MADPHNQELTEARINIARLESEVAHLTAAVADVKVSLAETAEKLDVVLLKLSEARGGWRTLMLVGGAASSLGAGLTWVVAHMPKAFQ